MTLSDYQRAQLVLFAAREAGPGASLEQMKAICYCIRNRVRAGWFDGSWISCIDHAHEVNAHEPTTRFYTEEAYRPFQRLLRDVDDIYYGNGQPKSMAESATDEGISLEESVGQQMYWCFINRPIRPWFAVNIVSDQINHPSRSQMGLLMFYE